MLTANDNKFAHIISKTVLLVDFTKCKASVPTLAGNARAVGCRHWFDNDDGLVKDAGGTFLGGNTLNVYHIASVKNKLFIVSTKQMGPSDTRPIAERYLKQLKSTR